MTNRNSSLQNFRTNGIQSVLPLISLVVILHFSHHMCIYTHIQVISTVYPACLANLIYPWLSVSTTHVSPVNTSPTDSGWTLLSLLTEVLSFPPSTYCRTWIFFPKCILSTSFVSGNVLSIEDTMEKEAGCVPPFHGDCTLQRDMAFFCMNTVDLLHMSIKVLFIPLSEHG